MQLCAQDIQILGKFGSHFRVAQGNGDSCLQVAEPVAAVKALPSKAIGENLTFADEPDDAIGELNLATGARGGFFQKIEDPCRQDVVVHDAEIGRSILGVRFFHNANDLEDLIIPGYGRDNAIAAGVFSADLLHREDAGLEPLVLLHHLRQYRLFGEHEIVGEKNGEGLIVDHLVRHKHRVAEAQRVRLTQEEALTPGGRIPCICFRRACLPRCSSSFSSS